MKMIKNYLYEKCFQMVIDYCHDHRKELSTRYRKATNDLPDITLGMISAYEDIELFCKHSLKDLKNKD